MWPVQAYADKDMTLSKALASSNHAILAIAAGSAGAFRVSHDGAVLRL